MTAVTPLDHAARRLAGVCSLITAGIAGFALLSWGLDRWQAGALGANYVPMAPTTALAMFGLNSAVWLRSRWPERAWATRLSLWAGLGVALLGLAVLLQGPFSFELVLEQWLSRTTDTVRGIPVGRMSPWTALTFLLAAGALLGTRPALPRSRWVEYPVLVLAGGVTLIGLVFALGYASGTPLFYGRQTIPLALLTAVSFLLSGLGLLAVGLGPKLQRWQHERSLLPVTHPAHRFDWPLITAFVLLAAAIGTAGFFYLRRQQAHLRQTMHEELAAIANLKVEQIVHWRRERFADANLVRYTPYAARRALDALADPTSPTTQQMFTGWLRPFLANGHYRQALVLDAQMNVRLVYPEGSAGGLSETERRSAEQALRTREVLATDLHRPAEDQPAQLSLLVPLVVRREGAQDNVPAAGLPPSPADRSAGALVLRIDAQEFLYPLVQAWPTPSRSAETVLVRREGDELVFLNELRHRTNTALNLRFTIHEPNLTAAIVLRGQEGIVEGLDYRNVPVLTSFRRVPDSPWWLGAKVDQAEIYGPLRTQALAVGSVVAVLGLAVALALGLVLRQRDAGFLRRELAVERERKALAERFAHLMQHANDIILLADPAWRILEANGRALEWYGYSLAELLQKTLPDLRAPATRADFARQIEPLLAQGGAVFETLQQRQDGATFPVEVSARLVDIAGIKYKLAIIRDITQRRAHEREIERLTRLYATLSQVNQALVRANSRDELLAEVCRIAVEFGGFQLAWIGWHNPETRVITPVACAGGPQEFIGRIRHGSAADAEHGCLCGTAIRDGRTCVANEVRNAPEMQGWESEVKRAGLRATAALPIRFRGVAQGVLVLGAAEAGIFREKEVSLLEEVALDIAFGLERLESETQLHQTLDRLTTLVRTSPLPIILTDAAGRVTLWNPVAERVFGWTEAETIGRDNPIVPADKADEVRQVRARILAGDSFAHHETVRQRKDGALLPVSFSAAALRDPQGQAIGLMAIVEDITERKQIEAETLRLNRELEQRVRQRTAELTAANRELESFAYSVSHDLRAPLRHIDGFCNLLRRHLDQRLDPRSEHYLRTVNDAAQRMGMLIDDLLLFSRTGRAELRPAEVRLDELVREVLHELEPERAGRPVEWQLGPLPVVRADRALLRQVFVNLLANALKFTRPRHPARIAVSGRNDPADGVVVFVRDNGVGFDPAYAHKLFGVFQRLHLAEEFEGTGIGLANVQRIVQRHGGRTWAEGKPGEGAVFYFSLPRDGDTGGGNA